MMDRAFAFYVRNRQNMRVLGLLLAGIVIAAVAQVTLTLSLQQPGFWDIGNWLQSLGNNSSPLLGLMLYALAGSLFTLGLRAAGDISTPIVIKPVTISQRRPRFGFWITSLGLTMLTAVYAASPEADSYGLQLAIVWIINVILLIITVLIDERWQAPSAPQIKQWVKTHLAELSIIAIVVSLAFIIRLINVELIPYSFINDEGEMGNGGACILLGNCANLFAMGWAGQPMLAFLPTAISIALLGHSALAVRLVSVCTGTLAVLAVYLFSREVFNKNTAWVAALLLATLPFNVHFSRIGVDNIIDSLSTTAILWLIFRGGKRSSTLSFLAAGIWGGLCFYTYPGTRLAPVLGLFALGYFTLQARGFLLAHLRNIFIYVLAFTVTAAPILGFFITHPDYFSARMMSAGIFQNNDLQNVMHDTGKSAFEILTGQFMKSNLVFIVTSAPSNFFNSPKPYLIPLAAIFFMLGLAYTIWRLKNSRFLMLFIWFWAAIILGSTITGGPPTSQRMLMSSSALAIITALGITKTIENIPQIGKPNRWLQPLVLLAFVLFIGYKDINFYFGEYQSGHFFEDPTNEFTYETHLFITPLHKDGRFYLLSEPSVPYLSFANFDYFSPDVEKAYLNEVTLETLKAIPTDKDVLFIATPGRQADLEQIKAIIPEGDWNEIRRRNQPNEILFYSYKIKKDLLQAFNLQTHP